MAYTTTPALVPQNGFSTTLSSTITATDTVIYLNALPTATEGFLIIDEGLSSEEEIFYSSKGSNFVTVPSATDGDGRGIASTSPTGHSSGAGVKMKTVAEYFKALQDGTALNTNSIQASKLATSAITLGYAQVTVDSSTTSTTPVQISGLTSTVTVPAGGRRVKVTVYAPFLSSTTGNPKLTLWDGVVNTGTGLQAMIGAVGNGGTMTFVHTPSAGSKTYNVGINITGGGGTATNSAAAANPSFILVEAI